MAISVPHGTVEIPDIEVQDEVRLPVDETAIVVVDMQNDFVKPGGNLVVEDASETIPNIQQLLEAGRENGVPIAYTQDTAVEGDPEFDQAMTLRQVSWLYAGQVVRSTRDIHFED